MGKLLTSIEAMTLALASGQPVPQAEAFRAATRLLPAPVVESIPGFTRVVQRLVRRRLLAYTDCIDDDLRTRPIQTTNAGYRELLSYLRAQQLIDDAASIATRRHRRRPITRDERSLAGD